MSKPEFSRPFNLENAKAGAPYCCRDGGTAQVLKWDCNVSDYPLLGVIRKSDDPRTWTETGSVSYAEKHTSQYDSDLVMLPLGMCQLKPVFMGDELVTRFGDKFVVEVKHIGDLDEENTWPVPAVAYPESTMCLSFLTDMLGSSVAIEGSMKPLYGKLILTIHGKYSMNEMIRLIGNSALRHAIDAGQVVLPGAVPSNDLLMKVAKAVMIEMRGLGGMAVYGFNENNCKSIIASVTGAKDAKEGAQ